MRSLPLGLYLEKPVTPLHRLDARVKLAWLAAILLAPILASGVARLALVALLVGVTIAAGIPGRVWRQQMGWLTFVAVFATFLTAIAPDGYGLQYQGRSPANPAALAQPAPPSAPWYAPWSAPAPSAQSPNGARPPAISTSIAKLDLPQPTSYRYWLVRQGPLAISRRSLSVGLRLGTLLFVLIYSTSLYLLVTAPEEITASLERLLWPLTRWGVPITELILTLTLSLRFIPLVLEEVQNLVRAVQTRAIDWRQLGIRGGLKIWLAIVERLFDNLLLRAEQMASAMKVRGFTSPDHYTTTLFQPHFSRWDWLAIGVLVVFVGLRSIWGWQPA